MLDQSLLVHAVTTNTAKDSELRLFWNCQLFIGHMICEYSRLQEAPEGITLSHLLVSAIFSCVYLIKPTVTEEDEIVWTNKKAPKCLGFFLHFMKLLHQIKKTVTV